MDIVEILWSDRKAEANFAKHSVSFDEAATVFGDPLARMYADTHPVEERMLLVGHSREHSLLIVVYIEITEDTFRIISARHTTARERRLYEEGI